MLKLSYNKITSSLLKKLNDLKIISIEEDDGISYYDIMIMSNVDPEQIQERMNKNPLSKKSIIITTTKEEMSLKKMSMYYECGATCVCGKDSTKNSILESIKSIISSIMYDYCCDTIEYKLTKYTTFIPGKATMISGGSEYHLNPKEILVFKMLCDNIGNYIPKKTFLYTIWGNTSHGSDRSFDVYINRLRHIIENDECVSLTKKWGVGYMLSGEK